MIKIKLWQFRLRTFLIVPMAIATCLVAWLKFHSDGRKPLNVIDPMVSWTQSPVIPFPENRAQDFNRIPHRSIFKVGFINFRFDNVYPLIILCSVSDKGEMIVFRNGTITPNVSLIGRPLAAADFSRIKKLFETIPAGSDANIAHNNEVFVGILDKGLWRLRVYDKSKISAELEEVLTSEKFINENIMR